MKLNDALSILGLSGSNISLADAKKGYRAQSLKFHPDVNPSGLQVMKMINAAWDYLKTQAGPFNVATEEPDNANYADDVSEALNKIINCVGIDIEICGTWVWVSGDTKTNKDSLKAAKFRYSGSKKMWYYAPKASPKRFRGKQFTIGEIREAHGSKRVSRQYKKALAS